MPRKKLSPKNFAWTPNLAYAIGLLTTDGCLSNDGRHIIMRSSEIKLLKTFKQCLDINNKIGKTRNGNIISYRVHFGNIQFYNWLLKIGLFPAKSYTIAEINVPDALFRDFLRGCIDGDGNIRTYQDTYNVYRSRRYTTQRLFIRTSSASQKHIIWLQKRIRFLVNISGAIIKSEPASKRRVPIWQLQFAKKESLRLINWVYYKPNIPCLERKKLIAEKAVDIISRQKRREYSII